MGGDRREWKGTESVLVCQVPYLVSRYKVVGGGVVYCQVLGTALLLLLFLLQMSICD